MDINSTLANEPMILGLTSMVNTVKVLVGGVFGFYIIMFIWRIYAYKRNSMFFKRLRKDIHKMTSAIVGLEHEVRGLKRKINSKKKK